jgi:hypothetical protein
MDTFETYQRHVNLNMRNFVFIYAYNVRYMGFPKRSGQ